MIQAPSHPGHINHVDHDMYPVTYAMEQRMVKWLHDLRNGPKDAEPVEITLVGYGRLE